MEQQFAVIMLVGFKVHQKSTRGVAAQPCRVPTVCYPVGIFSAGQVQQQIIVYLTAASWIQFYKSQKQALNSAAQVQQKIMYIQQRCVGFSFTVKRFVLSQRDSSKSLVFLRRHFGDISSNRASIHSKRYVFPRKNSVDMLMKGQSCSYYFICQKKGIYIY